MVAMMRWLYLLSLMATLVACNMEEATIPGGGMNTAALEQWYQDGRAAYAAGNYEEAASLFARIVAVDPENLKARINWGAALSRGGKPLEAMAHFQEALARDPTSAEAYFNWGAALARLQKHEEAVEKFDQAFALKDIEALQLSKEVRHALDDYLQRHRPQEQGRRIEVTPQASPPPSLPNNAPGKPKL